MVHIDNYNNFSMTRGDDVTLSVDLIDENGEAYEMESDDVLTLTVRAYVEASEPLFTVSATGTNRLTIASADTAELSPNRYVYDIQLTKGDGTIHTVVGSLPNRNIYFYLQGDVTR